MALASILKRFENKKSVDAFRERSLCEGHTKQQIVVVLMKGADKEKVDKAVEAIKTEKPSLQIKIISEPEGMLDIPKNTAAIVFVANGSNKGIDRLMDDIGSARETDRVAAVLVSDHTDQTNHFDHTMTFKNAIMEGRLLLAIKAGVYYKRAEAIN